MIALLSPAKRLDPGSTPAKLPTTAPALLSDARRLARRAQRLGAADLVKLMGISKSLAQLNVRRFSELPLEGRATGQPAIHLFQGDTYQGFDAGSLDDKALSFAQEHVRILSGLYGLLRPFDLIQPYRLEMGTKLETDAGRDLYEFWGDHITDAINQLLSSARGPVVNLASAEYFRAVKPERLGGKLVTCVFKEVKGGKAKVVGFSAKRARGMMARFICQHRLKKASDLEAFDLGGYVFKPELSSDATKEFHRGG